MKKTAAFLLAATVMAGASVFAMAAEDFAPGENPNNMQGVRGILPESYIPSPNAPVLSVEDYQELNDAMGLESEDTGRIPAYGSVGSTASAPAYFEDEEATAAATTPVTEVPKIEPYAAGTTNQPNPNTGAADSFIPVMTAILSLAAAPIVTKIKK